MKPASTTEVAVVGAGIVGLATTDALIQAGVEVRCFEKGLPGQAQSGGLTRIFRHRHSNRQLVELAVEARRGWLAWESRAHRELLGREGLLVLGDGLSSEVELLDAAGVRWETVSHDSVCEVLPVLAAGPGGGVHEPDGGAIRASEAVQTLSGWTSDVREHAEVLALREESYGVVLQTSTGFHECRRAIVCAGVSSPALASGVGLDLPIHVTCHARPTFRIAERTRSLPCLQDLSGHWGEQAYGSIAAAHGLYAVGLRARSEFPVGHGAQMTAEADLRRLVARTCEYVGRGLPGLDPEPVAVRICFSTRLPGSHDGFQVAQSERVTAIAGHNLFKFAPALGALLARGATEHKLPAELAGGRITARI